MAYSNPEKRRAYQSRLSHILRARIIEHYGGPVCVCCGETTYAFLTLDHVNGGGNEHRREAGDNSGHLYSWLNKNGWPEGFFQVLCFNCNNAKHQQGVCPHQVKQEAQ